MNPPPRWRVLLRGSLVTLKHHRFEVGAATLTLVALGVWALTIEYQLSSLRLPSECIRNLLQNGSPDESRCAPTLINAWTAIINFQAGPLMGIQAWVPLLVGLLGGVPIVAREIEAGTAQTAWSLYGSRRRWLAAQLMPVVVTLGAASLFTAAMVSVIEQHRIEWGEPARLYSDIGLHGIPAVARTLGAFGLGLLAGAIVGRSLPAFVIGLAFALTVSAGVGWAGDQWLAAQPAAPLDEDEAALITQWMWLTPEGTLIDDTQAKGLVPPDVAAQDVGSVQAGHSIEWLQERGYQLVAAGVSNETAAGWSPYYSAAFTAAGATAILLATVVINRRRPT